MTPLWVFIIVFCSGAAATLLTIGALLRLALWYNSVYLPRQEPTLIERDGILYRERWVYDPVAKTSSRHKTLITSMDDLMQRARDGETTPMPELHELYDKDGNWKQ
jgi:hypothetical protein